MTHLCPEVPVNSTLNNTLTLVKGKKQQEKNNLPTLESTGASWFLRAGFCVRTGES